jgi:hypothetical protein
MERLAAQHHLEPVVLGRIVAAGDGNATVGAQFMGGEVGHRGRHPADVDDVDTRLRDAFRQGPCQLRAGEAAVAADDDGLDVAATASLPSAWPIWRTVAAVSVVRTMPRMS